MMLRKIRVAGAGLLTLAGLFGALTYGCGEDGETTVQKMPKRDAAAVDPDPVPKSDASTSDASDSGNDSGKTDATTATGAKADVAAIAPATVNGAATFAEATGGGVDVTLTLKDGPPGPHGVHIHAGGDCADGGAGALGHFNPGDAGHGLPDGAVHHAGDFGNIVIDDAGKGTLSLRASELSLGDGGTSIVGRTIVVHENPDDGTAGDAGPGNSGARIGCGVIKKN